MAELLLGAALVTGANRGIGLEMIRQLVAGVQPPKILFAGCRDPEGSRARDLKDIIEKHPNVTLIKLDVNDSGSIAECAGQVEDVLGKEGLNLLINNAGVMFNDTLETMTAENMVQMYTTNSVAPAMVTKAFLPALKRAAALSQAKGLSCSKAAVINISSIWGSLELYPSTKFPHKASAYRASKAAVNMITRCLAHDLKSDGILCAALHPGWVQTEMGGNQAPLSVDNSVRGLFRVMASLSDKENGGFLDWKGEILPW